MPNIRALTKELQEVSITELNETPERIASDLAALKTWISKTPHLNPRTDDQFLMVFLRSSKFSLERAKERLDNFYAIRSALPDVFANRLVTDELIDFLREGIFFPLPHTDSPAGARLFMFRVSYDPEKYDCPGIYRMFTMLTDIMMLEDDKLIVSGSKYVTDFKGAKAAHFTAFTPTFMKKLAVVLQDGNPFRAKSLQYINCSSTVATVVNLFKTFTNEKLRSRVSFESSFYLFEVGFELELRLKFKVLNWYLKYYSI